MPAGAAAFRKTVCVVRVGEENGVPVGGECLQPDTQRQRQHAKNAAGSKTMRLSRSRAGNVAPPVIIFDKFVEFMKMSFGPSGRGTAQGSKLSFGTQKL